MPRACAVPRSVGDLLHHVERVARRQALLAGERALEVAALQVLHADVEVALRVVPEVVQLHRVGVDDLRVALRLVVEAAHHLRVTGEGGVQELDGDLLADPDVLGLVDHAHAAWPSLRSRR
jgi:hypothetical protein